MHIVLVNHMFLDGGGREEHVFQIAKYFAEKGYRVSIVTSDYSPTGENIFKKRVDKIPGIKLVTLKGYLTNTPPGRVNIPDLTDFLVNYKADIIHAHGMGEQAAESAFYAAKIKNVPFVYTLHFAPYTIYKKLNAEHIWKVLQQYHLYGILRGTDKIIAVSPDEKEDIIHYSEYNGNNFAVIPNGFERADKKIDNDTITKTFEKFGITPGRKYITYIGSLTNPRKGAFEAIQAFRSAQLKYPDLHLILMGMNDSRLTYPGKEKIFTKILTKLMKANQVTITGWVNDNDKHTLLQGSDIMISPTTYEAFGIALCEALYNKTPVIATDIGGCRYVIRNGIDGILVKDQSDIQGFTDAMIQLLADPEKRKKMGQAGHERVSKMFSWEKMGEELESTYKRLIHSK
ncbi:MAG TPA: glycosyltransferase family 4 protein [Candidatus Woesebacteria bacterium]|nr:glycosyltransferase family 4 protein [Candidatus Woesebacteria bacterium]